MKASILRVAATVLVVTLVSGLSFCADIPSCLSAPSHVLAAPQNWWDEVDLLSRLIMGEATGEPFSGQVGVAAVVMNRTQNAAFPATVPGVIYETDAFESVSIGLIWSGTPDDNESRAAELAINGWASRRRDFSFWAAAPGPGPSF